jgi:hypothetical protein
VCEVVPSLRPSLVRLCGIVFNEAHEQLYSYLQLCRFLSSLSFALFSVLSVIRS